ncbi:hypothetical protein PGTUg99_035155 [Puccinia graminis f. sp. tritici]|uniref:Uncharacterized protein n=1 Tax=Puccinia graminis f. sp. tritici TaxID=56615 RepID=A0A5B0N2Q3_PUCGR|nr:hypothetical protein PGTUg99_035155 [Puccinia graminis f. sp. tritici]
MGRPMGSPFLEKPDPTHHGSPSGPTQLGQKIGKSGLVPPHPDPDSSWVGSNRGSTRPMLTPSWEQPRTRHPVLRFHVVCCIPRCTLLLHVYGKQHTIQIPKAKKKELCHPHSRFLLASRPHEQDDESEAPIAGFLMWKFDFEECFSTEEASSPKHSNPVE